MKTKILFLIFTVALCGTVWATTIYTYRCPSCGLIQQYTRPGIYKCPKDGWFMLQIHDQK